MKKSMLKILALDSTAEVSSVAVCEGEKILSQITVNTGNTHSQTLLPAVESALNLAELKVDNIDVFACSVGPGSFTGVRIGVATVKGLAFGKVSELTEGIEFALPTIFSHAETPSSAIQLQSGQDFNDILEPGFYSIPNTAVSGTLLNKPWSSTATGGLYVTVEGDGMGKCQIAHALSKDYGAIYERSYYQSSWGAWKAVYNGGGKILWTGGYYMTAGQNATLSEPISAQPTGIVLVFGRYLDGAAQDNNFIHCFVPKAFVSEMNGYGHTFILAANRFAVIATKYLYVNNDRITGHADNNISGTANGITFNNAGFVLRYVIGV